MKQPRILLFDVECAPARGLFWEMWETNVIEVEEHSFMLCFSAKWLGENKTYVHALPDFPTHKKDKHDDRELLMKLSEYLEAADIIIGHNGDSFDLKYTNTRLVINRLAPISPKKTFDTLKAARRYFRFISNKLDDLASVLGVGRKLAHTGKKLWLACRDSDDPKAWKLMKDYNVQDTKLLERVYLILRPFAANHPNINVWTRKNGCRVCQSTRLVKEGLRPTLTGYVQKWSCLDCFAWSSGPIEKLEKVTIN